MPSLKSDKAIKLLLGLFLVLGIYPLLMIARQKQGAFQGLQWGLWLLFYALLTFTFVFYAATKCFFARAEQVFYILYLNVFIALAVVLKVIPLPLGMSLAFVLPILCAALIHPYWGALVGFFMVMISAFVSGGLGPWTPIQAYVLVVIPAFLIWVPPVIRRRRFFVIGYGVVWGPLYGVMMSLYFWPVLSKPIGEASQWTSFWVFYTSTSLTWDLFRAAGNAIFLAALYNPFEKTLTGCADLTQWGK